MKPKNPFHALRQLAALDPPYDSTGKKLRKRRSKNPSVFVGSSLAGLKIIMMSCSAYAQSSFSGTWENFTIVSAAGVTNTGPTIVFGNIGLYPTPSITGFPPGVVVNGTIFGPSPLTQLAQTDSRATWVNLSNSISTGVLTGINLGEFGTASSSPALVPGVYAFASSAQLTGTLELNATTENSVFVFKIASSLTTAANSRVIITGANAGCARVFWQVGSSATIGTGTEFNGNILAESSITFNTGATLVNGRAIALTGAVTLDSNNLMVESLSSSCNFGLGGSGSPITANTLTPEELTAIFQLGFSTAAAQNLNIQRHLEAVRRSSGAPPRTQFVPVPTDSKGGLGGSKGGLMEQTVTEGNDRLWSVYLEGTDASASVDGSSNASGYNFDTRGATLGVDRRVNDNFVVGVLGSYTSSDAQLFNGGSIDGEGYKGAIYATLFKGGFFLDALVGAGSNSYETTRSSLLGFAEGNADGWEFNSLINGGYDIHQGNWTITPMASAAYTRVNLDSFTETGSLSPLTFPEQNQDSLRSELGVKISYSATLNNGMVLTPQVRLAWQHEFLDSTQSINSGFVSVPGTTFTSFGPDIDRDRALLSAGLNLQVTPTVNVYAYYDGQLGSSNSNFNSVTAGVRWIF